MPDAIPETMPDVEPMVATDASVDVHIPPEVLLCNTVVAPTQTLGAPVMAEGPGVTIRVVVVKQPVGKM